MNVLLTGSTGFIGRALLEKFNSVASIKTSLIVRSAPSYDDSRCFSGDLSGKTDWSAALKSQELVVHAAARNFVMKEETSDPLAAYRRVNLAGTLDLAQQAAAAGVRRFIFISTIKVNGESTPPNQMFRASDPPAPEDAYALSKLEAERGLMQLAAETGLEVIIIRPPLVYGPGAKGNFSDMIKLLEKRLPLPLGAINNKRSLVGIGNLVDLVFRCLDHPAATNQIFLAGDGVDLSTTELLELLAEAMDKPARLIPVPASVLQVSAILLGKKAMARRLLGSLQVDISKTRRLLGWTPPYTVEEGLRCCFESSNQLASR